MSNQISLLTLTLSLANQWQNAPKHFFFLEKIDSVLVGWWPAPAPVRIGITHLTDKYSQSDSLTEFCLVLILESNMSLHDVTYLSVSLIMIAVTTTQLLPHRLQAIWITMIC